MALPSNPGRDEIWMELEESTYRNGGVNTNGLNAMHDYVFGAGSYTRDGFGGYGIPELASSLSATAGDGELDLIFTVNTDGGSQMTFVAEYWPTTTDPELMGGNWQTIGTGNGSGQFTKTLTGLTNGQSYDVRVTAYNKFNNSGNYVNYSAPASPLRWDYTNIVTAVPEQPQFNTPSIITCSYIGFSNEIHVEWNYGASPSSFSAQTNVNGAGWTNATLQSSSNWGGSSNPKTGNWSVNPFPNPGDTIQVRIRADAEGSNSASDYSSPCQDTY